MKKLMAGLVVAVLILLFSIPTLYVMLMRGEL